MWHLALWAPITSMWALCCLHLPPITYLLPYYIYRSLLSLPSSINTHTYGMFSHHQDFFAIFSYVFCLNVIYILLQNNNGLIEHHTKYQTRPRIDRAIILKHFVECCRYLFLNSLTELFLTRRSVFCSENEVSWLWEVRSTNWRWNLNCFMRGIHT